MMKTKEFNKLVRDRIPYIIECSGRTVFSKILSDEEFIVQLHIKAEEEVVELREAIKSGNIKSITEELADVLLIDLSLKKLNITPKENLEALINSTKNDFHISSSKLDKVFKFKNKDKGQFLQKIFLIKTEEKI